MILKVSAAQLNGEKPQNRISQANKQKWKMHASQRRDKGKQI
jgi:hypothetical protein